MKTSDSRFKKLDQMCFLAKNLYNAALYEVRQKFFEDKSYLNYYEVNRLLHDRHDENYFALPSNTSQEVLKAVDRNYVSFFNSLKSKNIKHKVSIPHYLDKEHGRFALTYNKMTLSKKHLEKGLIRLPKADIQFASKHCDTICQVRVVPKLNFIVIEVIYEAEEQELKAQNGNWLSIDLGIDNLATCTSNIENAFIIDGKPLKSINQFYNKQLSHYKSKLSKDVKTKKTSKKIKALTLKRNCKVKDYMHKASRLIVNQAADKSLNTIVIGYSKGWKQDTSMSKKVNQNFVQIPF